MLEPRWSKVRDLRSLLAKDLEPLMRKLGNVLLNIEKLQEDQTLQRDVRAALKAIEQVYGRLGEKNVRL